MKTTCICCKSTEVIQLLDLGEQPPSNRFLHKHNSGKDKHLLIFGICENCEHMQILDPMDVEMVQSRFDWITYNEPEGHLDDVVSNILNLPRLDAESRVLGITYKDDTVLDRLRQYDFDNLYRLGSQSDLSIADNSGLEVIQSVITTDVIEKIANKLEQSDLVIARHILEHTHNPDGFIRALKLLVKNKGYLVFEVPDSEKFMRSLDYPFIWEEHISYFIESSLKRFLEKQNLKLIGLHRYGYTFEDSLVVITEVNKEEQNIDAEMIQDNNVMGLARNYADNFPLVKNDVRNKLKEYLGKGKKVGLFGAGHLAVKYLNFFELADHVEMVIDDHPDKKGLYMPGSGLPIVDSSYLEQLDLCLLSLSPESEEKVLKKYNSFIDNGGEFRSIFAASPISLIGMPLI